MAIVNTDGHIYMMSNKRLSNRVKCLFFFSSVVIH